MAPRDEHSGEVCSAAGVGEQRNAKARQVARGAAPPGNPAGPPALPEATSAPNSPTGREDVPFAEHQKRGLQPVAEKVLTNLSLWQRIKQSFRYGSTGGRS